MSVTSLVSLMLALAACGGGGGSAEGAPGGATPVTAPVISTSPAAQSVPVGGSATFTVAATGGGLSYAWMRSTDAGLTWAFVSNAAQPGYTVSPVDASMQGHQFRVLIQNTLGAVTSSPATLTVTGLANAAPVITQQPQDRSSTPPATATFSVAATGTPAPSYQWQLSIDGGRTWVALAGGAQATITTPQARAFSNGSRYRVLVSNSLGSVTSTEAVWQVVARSLGGAPQAVHARDDGTLAVVAAPMGLPLEGITAAGVVSRVGPSGVVTPLAGGAPAGFVNGPGSVARFNSPIGVVQDAAGDVFVTDYVNHAIRRIAADGTVSTFAGGVPGFPTDGALPAVLRYPQALALAADGALYFTDSGSNRVRRVATGAVSTLGIAMGSPIGLALDAAGNLFFTTGGSIYRAAPDGSITTPAGGTVIGFTDGIGAAASFNVPTALATDRAGNVYVGDSLNFAVRKITPAGVVTTLAGGGPGARGYVDGTGRAARFGGVKGLAVDAAGNVYVADDDNMAIRRITPAGVVSTVAQ